MNTVLYYLSLLVLKGLVIGSTIGNLGRVETEPVESRMGKNFQAPDYDAIAAYDAIDIKDMDNEIEKHVLKNKLLDQ